MNVFDLVPIAVFLKSTSGEFVWSNRYHQKTTRSLVDKILPKAHDLHPAIEANAFRIDDLRVTTTGNPIVGRRETATFFDGRVANLLTTKIPVRNAQGSIIGLLGFCNEQDTSLVLDQLYDFPLVS